MEAPLTTRSVEELSVDKLLMYSDWFESDAQSYNYLHWLNEEVGPITSKEYDRRLFKSSLRVMDKVPAARAYVNEVRGHTGIDAIVEDLVNGVPCTVTTNDSEYLITPARSNLGCIAYGIVSKKTGEEVIVYDTKAVAVIVCDELKANLQSKPPAPTPVASIKKVGCADLPAANTQYTSVTRDVWPGVYVNGGDLLPTNQGVVIEGIAQRAMDDFDGETAIFKLREQNGKLDGCVCGVSMNANLQQKWFIVTTKGAFHELTPTQTGELCQRIKNGAERETLFDSNKARLRDRQIASSQMASSPSMHG
jgi:hypothetical protein